MLIYSMKNRPGETQTVRAAYAGAMGGTTAVCRGDNVTLNFGSSTVHRWI